jgi:hypothetical protein
MKRVLVVLVLMIVSSAVAQQKQPTPQPPAKGIPTIRVWVDTEFGFYHCPNTKLYGKTKQGVYMTQKQAQDRGYRPAYGSFCNTVPKTLAKPGK